MVKAEALLAIIYILDFGLPRVNKSSLAIDHVGILLVVPLLDLSDIELVHGLVYAEIFQKLRNIVHARSVLLDLICETFFV